LKRGGGVHFVELPEAAGAELLDLGLDRQQLTPEQIFDAGWNAAVMASAFARLEARLRAEGRERHFEVFRRYDLEAESDAPSYGEVAQALGLSIPQVKHALLEARKLVRQIIVDMVRTYTDGPDEFAAELGNLLGP